MITSHEFLKALAIVLGVAAVTTVVFQRLRQPVVLGYILAGLIVGPNVPVPLVADREIIRTLSELGVILLMFSLGLEFSLRKLIRVGATSALVAVIETSLMVWAGTMAGRAFGWSHRESLFAGAVVAISSTTIVAKAFDESRIKGRMRELAFGILIAEDLIAILLMAVLTAVSSGDGVSGGTVARSAGRLAAFLAGVLVVGLIFVPRLVRAINRLKRPETTLVASIGICFGLALLANAFGYSVALGAFLAGTLVAESGDEARIEPLIAPVRDMFAAIFFVSVGMTIEPAAIWHHWLPIVVFTLVVLVGKTIGVSAGAFFTGHGVRASVQAGMSLAQIGEFSFIIAALGMSLGVTGEPLYALAVAVSTLTTLTTPWMIRAGDGAARAFDHWLPQRLQTFAALYGSWLEGLRTRRQDDSSARLRRKVKLLLVDGAVFTAVVIGAASLWWRGAAVLTTRLGLPAWLAAGLVIAGGVLLAAPFGFGVLRMARAVGVTIAERALPSVPDGTLDLAAAPRKALVMGLQLVIAMIIGLPLLALVQPFLPRWGAAAMFAVAILTLGLSLHRTTRNLQGHVRAGAELVVEVLTAQARKGSAQTPNQGLPLVDVRGLLPGLGQPTTVLIPEGSRAVGKSLAELEVRSATGASVLAIVRGDSGVTVPNAGERLRAGDVLALVGTSEAVAAARALLAGDNAAEAPATPDRAA